jgi:hypothetical protein
MRYLILLALFLSLSSKAETFLCVGETGAGVENTGAGGFKSEIYDVSDLKLILTTENGSWVLKNHGQDRPIFDHCDTEYFCMMKNGYSGVFIRNGYDASFIYSIMKGYGEDLKKSILFTTKGLCTKI